MNKTRRAHRIEEHYCFPPHAQMFIAPKIEPQAIDPLREIINHVANALKVDSDKMQGACRLREICEARFISYAMIRQLYPRVTRVKMGSLFQRDHSTVIYGLQTFDALFETEYSFRAKYIRVISAYNIKKYSHEI